MKTSRFRLKLFISLLVFAIVVTFAITIVDFVRLHEQTIENSEVQIEQATEMVLYALKTVDKAYMYLDEETAEKMKGYTNQLQDMYAENPDFETWDFGHLSEAFKMDVYVLNQGNKIIYSNVEEEIDLDFTECCGMFSKLLDERRATGELFIDGIDIDQKSGAVKKFSYMATADKKYIFELGYALEDEDIFQAFNFLAVADDVVDHFSLIEEMHVLNKGGLPFGVTEEVDDHQARKEAFRQARDEHEIVEIESTYNDEPVIYRFVPYVSEYDSTEGTQTKVIEVIYNQHQIDQLLQSNKNKLFMQLMIILFITIIVSSLLANWFARPVYLAYHDSLTGLRNRAAFDEMLSIALKEQQENTILLMIDLDNFKLVNDYLGHDKGDYVLKMIGQSIQEAIGSNYNVFRLGGDEFAVIVERTKEVTVEEIAKKVILKINESIENEQQIKMLSISASIGISFSAPEDSPADLYKKADIALYLSKEKGKNQFQIYSDKSVSERSFLFS